MAIKDTDRKARANYKKKTQVVRIELYGTDDDIQEHLEVIKDRGDSVQGYIKDLIRADLLKEEHEMVRGQKYEGFGETHSCPEWSLLLNIPRNTLWRHLKKGETIEEIALSRNITYK